MTINLELSHLLAFALGMAGAVLKDVLQIYVINRNMRKLGMDDMNAEMERLMQVQEEISKGFAPNTPDKVDKQKIETNYRSYYS